MFGQCIGMLFEEIVAMLSDKEQFEGCVDAHQSEGGEWDYSYIVYSVSPYGFYADSYEFVFDDEGRCVEVEFEEFEDD